jgi:D-alanine-D-alanine ligase
MKYRKVAVLMGGSSKEREVSLASGRAVAAGLVRAGFEVVEIDTEKDPVARILEAGVEAVYIALHGRFGEDGTLQGLLELIRMPYTGSSLVASAVSMDKQLTRDLLKAAGLPVAQGVVLEKEARALPTGWEVPLVVKPVNEGSSVGVSVVGRAADMEDALATAFALCPRVLVERFVEGKEVQVALLNDRVLGAIEIEPLRVFYDYQAKYEEGCAIHHIPPRISDAERDLVLDLGARAYRAVGCAGLARVDLILPQTGDPVILEVNTSPGMTELSLAPEIAAHAGLPFDTLVAEVMNSATLHVGAD